MLNQVVMVGRLTNDPVVEKLDNDKEVANITLAVPRSYKNADGVYETDFIDCVLWNSIATNTAEYTKKGDMIGIKGRVQSNMYENDAGELKKSTQIVAEKVTFLSSRSQEKDQEDLDM